MGGTASATGGGEAARSRASAKRIVVLPPPPTAATNAGCAISIPRACLAGHDGGERGGCAQRHRPADELAPGNLSKPEKFGVMV